MVRSETDNDKGTLPPKPVRRVYSMGSIPNTDEKFLEWCGYQTQMKKRGALEMMKLYVNQLNMESHMLYERQMKERKELIIAATNATDKIPAAELLEASMNNLNPQIIPAPNTQNISSPNTQNISSPNAQNTLEFQSQEQSAPLIPDYSSQISSVTPSLSSVPSTAPRTEQNLNANNLTMSQALELFEMLQSRTNEKCRKPVKIQKIRYKSVITEKSVILEKSKIDFQSTGCVLVSLQPLATITHAYFQLYMLSTTRNQYFTS
jgi:hypothetical protein